jgi:hypothetical protein
MVLQISLVDYSELNPMNMLVSIEMAVPLFLITLITVAAVYSLQMQALKIILRYVYYLQLYFYENDLSIKESIFLSLRAKGGSYICQGPKCIASGYTVFEQYCCK